MSTVTQAWVMTQRELLHWRREPWTPIFGVLFSIMLLLVFGYLFGGAIELPGGGDYLPYLVPGMLALAMMFGVETTMGAITNDSKQGHHRPVPLAADEQRRRALRPGRRRPAQLAAPARRAPRSAGCSSAGGSTASVGALAAVGLLLWLRFAVLWLGIWLGLTFRGEGAVMAVQVLVWPLGFLSNLFVAPETMPGWLGFLAQWNPVSATAAAARELFGNPTGITDGVLAEHAVLVAFGWPLVLTAVFLPLSARAYRNLSR